MSFDLYFNAVLLFCTKHLASAEAGANVLLTTDMKFLRNSQRICTKIAVKNPIEFVMEVLGYDESNNEDNEKQRGMETGTEALVKALGPVGMARYLEEYDNGGEGDYTKEKYSQPEYSIEDIWEMAKCL